MLARPMLQHIRCSKWSHTVGLMTLDDTGAAFAESIGYCKSDHLCDAGQALLSCSWPACGSSEMTCRASEGIAKRDLFHLRFLIAYKASKGMALCGRHGKQFLPCIRCKECYTKAQPSFPLRS